VFQLVIRVDRPSENLIQNALSVPLVGCREIRLRRSDSEFCLFLLLLGWACFSARIGRSLDGFLEDVQKLLNVVGSNDI
jgi:hypothetical protein